MKKYSLILLFCFAILLQAVTIYKISSAETSNNNIFEGASLKITTQYQIIKLKNGNQIQLLKVPDGFQYFDYSSGQSCLEIVFGYYKFPSAAIPYREDSLIISNQIDQYNFTKPQYLISAAQAKINKQTIPQRLSTFDLSVVESMSEKDLQDYLRRQIPVILLIKRRQNPSQGSYIVAIGYDDNNYYIQDPLKMGSIGYIPKGGLDQIWRTYIRSQNRRTNHLGIVIKYRTDKKIETVPLINPSP